MSNRINPMDQGLLGKIGNKVNDTGTTRKVSTDTPARNNEVARKSSGSDTVELTSSAKLLERLEKTLAATPAVDTARVDAVKAQIERGEYEIDAEKIADAMLRMDHETGGRK